MPAAHQCCFPKIENTKELVGKEKGKNLLGLKNE